MKITIDTHTDSKEDIRKAIELLKGLVGSHETKEYEPDESAATAFGSMFGSDAPEPKKEDDKPAKIELY